MTLHVILLPLSKELDEVVALKFTVQNLGEEVEVGHEGGLQNYWDVGGIEKLDWIGIGLTSLSFALQLQLNSEALYTLKSNK